MANMWVLRYYYRGVEREVHSIYRVKQLGEFVIQLDNVLVVDCTELLELGIRASFCVICAMKKWLRVRRGCLHDDVIDR